MGVFIIIRNIHRLHLLMFKNGKLVNEEISNFFRTKIILKCK